MQRLRDSDGRKDCDVICHDQSRALQNESPLHRAQFVLMRINTDNDIVERQRDYRPNNNYTSGTKTKTSFARNVRANGAFAQTITAQMYSSGTKTKTSLARFASSKITPITKPVKRNYFDTDTSIGRKPVKLCTCSTESITHEKEVP